MIWFNFFERGLMLSQVQSGRKVSHERQCEYLVLTGVFVISLQGMCAGMPETHYKVSPGSQIDVVPIAASAQSSVGSFADPKNRALQAASFLLRNRDKRNIVGVLVTWNAVDGAAKHRKLRYSCNSVQDVRNPPVVQ